MKLIPLILLFWLCSSVQPANEIEPVFGVRVSYTSTGQMNTYGLFLKVNGVVSKRRIVSHDEFVKFVTGHWPSVYNPNRDNLFEKHAIPCDVLKEEFSNKDIVSCDLLETLWKVRFDENPFLQANESGWSNDQFVPSKKQQLFLYKEYGIENIDLNFFIDTNFWKILQDIQDPEWIGKYKSLY